MVIDIFLFCFIISGILFFGWILVFNKLFVNLLVNLLNVLYVNWIFWYLIVIFCGVFVICFLNNLIIVFLG